MKMAQNRQLRLSFCFSRLRIGRQSQLSRFCLHFLGEDIFYFDVFQQAFYLF